jgi:hypothetical protein
LSHTNFTKNREWIRGATHTPLQTGSELVEQHKLHYKQGVNSWSNTNSTTNREWTRGATQTPLQTGSELVWSGSIEQHKLHYKQGVNSCGLEALSNTNSTTNREWTRGATQTPLRKGSELVEQHKLHYREWTRGATQTPLQTGSELMWSGSISSFCSTINLHRSTHVTNPELIHQGGK